MHEFEFEVRNPDQIQNTACQNGMSDISTFDTNLLFSQLARSLCTAGET
jgi:hypothetical protein